MSVRLTWEDIETADREVHAARKLALDRKYWTAQEWAEKKAEVLNRILLDRYARRPGISRQRSWQIRKDAIGIIPDVEGAGGSTKS